MKHYILEDNEIERWNQLFSEHLSNGGNLQIKKEIVRKAKDSDIIIGVPLKHPEKEIYRALLLGEKYDSIPFFTDAPLIYMHAIFYLEGLSQLGTYVLGQKGAPVNSIYLVGIDDFCIREKAMSEDEVSIEAGNYSHKTLKDIVIGRCNVALYKKENVIGGGMLTFGASRKELDEEILGDLEAALHRDAVKAVQSLGIK